MFRSDLQRSANSRAVIVSSVSKDYYLSSLPTYLNRIDPTQNARPALTMLNRPYHGEFVPPIHHPEKLPITNNTNANTNSTGLSIRLLLQPVHQECDQDDPHLKAISGLLPQTEQRAATRPNSVSWRQRVQNPHQDGFRSR